MNMSEGGNEPPQASIIIPFHDEIGSLPRLLTVLAQHALIGPEYEVIFVDDGSTDGSAALFSSRELEPGWKLVQLPGWRGKSAAIRQGIASARAPIIVTIDADLQYHPGDVPRLIEKVRDGFDAVIGRRHERWSTQPWARRYPTLAANRVVSFLFRTNTTDIGSGFVAYRAQVLKGLPLLPGDHRLLPLLIGRRRTITEVDVSFAPRMAGKSKYGLLRSVAVPLTIVSTFLRRRRRDR